jgi:hypothetical protein
MKLGQVVLVAVLVASCGGSTTAGLPPTTCGAYAEAYCAKEQSCTNGVNVTRDWGDMSTCVARQTLSCQDGLAAPHTGQSAALIEQCTSALGSTSCDALLTGTLPATCNPTGPGATGAACTFNGQCATGFCSGVRYATCGTCAAPPDAGTSCATSNCAHGQSCVWDGPVVDMCEPYATLGDACGAFANPPCSPDQTCRGASSTTGVGGICEPAVTSAGAACGSKNMNLSCDTTMGLWCIDDACVQITYASDGMTCGYVGTGLVECTGGTCYSSAGPYFSYAGPQTGTCKAFAADGAACDTAKGPGCMGGARCVTTGGGTAGVCTVPTASVSAGCP